MPLPRIAFSIYFSIRMNPLLEEPLSDPLSLYHYRDAISAVDLMAAAIAHLDFFTWLDGHPATLGMICAHFAIHERPTDVMMTLFAAQGLCQMNGGVWILTLRGREHLTKKSPWNLSPYYASMKDRPSTLDMLHVLKTGKPANWGSYDAQAWAQAMEREDFAASFTAAMDCRGILLGPALAKRVDLSKHTALLDIAGGSGIYACAIKARHPHMKTTVFERPPVDRIARECIAKHGVKVGVVAGDMFKDELPTGYDAHLWSNVLHDWDEATVRSLLTKSAAALPEGGLVIIHDAFLNKDKTGPLHVAEYSALLMNITEGRCYGLSEMAKYLHDAGFEWVAHHPTAVARGFIVAQKPE